MNNNWLWGTPHEIKFVTQTLGSMKPAPERAALILKYIEAAANRDDWGPIDPAAVIAAARKNIGSLQKKPRPETAASNIKTQQEAAKQRWEKPQNLVIRKR